jgi:integrase
MTPVQGIVIMSSNNLTAPTKPNKPYPEFPLFAHANGSWAKKIRGRLHYFGSWNDPGSALASYLGKKDDLHAGRTPRADTESTTVKDVSNAFLIHKRALQTAGELSPRTWAEYKVTCDLVVKRFGKHRLAADLGPDDFAKLRNTMARTWGKVRLSKIIGYTRSVFKHAYEAGLLDKPMRFGPGFARPSRKTLRLERAKAGPKLFTQEEIHKLLDAASVQVKAMLLLGINCGLGNSDCANLPTSAIDLKTGWLDFARPKTGIPRRCPLWPQTIAALKEALAARPEPKKAEHRSLAFITKYGQSWGKESSDNPLSKEIGKLLKAHGINGRQGLGFYTLRHVFRTVADEVKDQPAVDFIMGHARDDMASMYRERISDERLQAVGDYVRCWLWPATSTEAQGEKNSKTGTPQRN